MDSRHFIGVGAAESQPVILSLLGGQTALGVEDEDLKRRTAVERERQLGYGLLQLAQIKLVIKLKIVEYHPAEQDNESTDGQTIAS